MLYDIESIRRAVADTPEVMAAVEEGFIAYSAGRTQVPPVGHLAFPERRGDTHIKYGNIVGDDVFVIKVASGFYENAKLGLPSGSGIVLVFSAVTGFVQAVLMDDGYLTARRTAIAGAICAKHLAPRNPEAIGIIGTGEQARLQLTALRDLIPTRKVFVWGRDAVKASAYKADMSRKGYEVQLAATPAALAANCRLIVTTTASERALLRAEDIRPGTHITAMGTDSPGKNEIDASVFGKADLVVADSIAQCVDHGDISYAVQQGILEKDRIVELGALLAEGRGRRNEAQITVADLTGVAVQDIAIAKVALKHLDSQKRS